MHLHTTLCLSSFLLSCLLIVTTMLLCKLAAALFCVCIVSIKVQRDSADYIVPNILHTDKHQDK